MNVPQLLEPLTPAEGIDAMVSYLPVPGFGVLPVNAYLVHGREPVLIDTGLAALREPFMARLESLIDPVEIRWIWITHADVDHTGNLAAVLERAPRARIVTTFIGMAKMGLAGIPMDRVCLVNPGQRIDTGDRVLVALTPPTFDAPETTAVFESRSGTLFSADCFGALMQAPAYDASDLETDALRDGCVTWATIDAPWLPLTDADAFGSTLGAVEALDPVRILGAHLPPAREMTRTLLAYLAEARTAPRFVGPDQAALESMMAA
jgi:hypothetical protein